MSGVYLDREMQEHRAARACEGLDLPADVKAGAVKRLVESVLATTHFIPYGDAESLYAALAELGIK